MLILPSEQNNYFRSLSDSYRSAFTSFSLNGFEHHFLRDTVFGTSRPPFFWYSVNLDILKASLILINI